MTGCLVGSEEPSAHRHMPSAADGVGFELLKSQGTLNTDTDPETGSPNRQCLTEALTLLFCYSQTQTLEDFN